MSSNIDPTKPVADERPANSANLRANFAAAKSEIEQLQTDVSNRPTVLVTNGTGTTYPNLCAHTAFNSIDAVADTSIIAGGGNTGYPNKIGAISKPVGASGTHSDPAASTDSVRGLPWSTDSGYTSGFAKVATISGGYDNINNSIAGTISGGGHNFIPYHVNGHAAINGGSNNKNHGGWTWIGAGTGNTINSATLSTTYSGVACGLNNTINRSSKSFIGGGDTSTIDTTGSFNGIFCSYSSSISGTNGWAFLGTCNNSSITGSYSAAVAGNALTLSNSNGFIGAGDTCTISSAFSAIPTGSNITVNLPGCLAFGYDVRTISNGLTFSSGKLVNAGDVGNIFTHFALRTSTNSATNMGQVGGAFIVLSNSNKTVVVGKVMVVGIREDNGASAAFSLDFQAYWDGTTNTIYDSAGSGGSRSLVAVNSTQATAAGITTAPTLELNTGSLRPKVTGVSSVNIKWTAFIIATVAVV